MTDFRPLPPVAHMIDGRDVPSRSGRTFTSVDPSTGAPLAEVAFGDAADVDEAVQSAQHAFERGAWARMAPAERAQTMRAVGAAILARRDEIAAIESRDSGKPIAQARNEVARGASFFATFAALAELPNGRTYPVNDGAFAYSVREPYGVVAAISPWNFPFQFACWKTAPALAVGNSVVLKMAEQTPLSTAYLGRIALDAGLPPGVLNIVHGDGPTTGAALVAHPLVPKITFTGSSEVGRIVLSAAAQQVKSVHAELGGKTANIVFADADLRMALAGSVYTSFYNVGQVCTSGSRLLVQRSLLPGFLDDLLAWAKRLRVGAPADPATQVGPLVSEEQLDRVSDYIRVGRSEGATLAIGGQAPAMPEALRSGYFVAPTVFLDVDPAMRIAQEEIFGPVLCVMAFDDEDEAVRLANGVPYGLAATVWTRDLGRAFRVARRLDVGTVWTNCPHFRPLNVPYAGRKLSGLGEDLGVEVLDTFTHLKTHYLQTEPATFPWAPPAD